MAESDRCPSCDCPVKSDSFKCGRCDFPLQMLRNLCEKLPAISIPAVFSVDARPSERTPISRDVAVKANLKPEKSLVIGSQSNASIVGVAWLKINRHEKIAAEHVVVFCDKDKRSWVALIDETAQLPLVNGRQCIASELSEGSVLQIGPYGWAYDALSLSLRPLGPIHGSELIIEAEVPGRLLRTELLIKPHEMVAITGPSGCGKSTLIDEIRSGRGVRTSEEELYFVPQRDLLHDDLSIRDELEFVAEFYSRDEKLPWNIDDTLQSVGLAVKHAEMLPSELSGGQLRRCRIAAALLSGRGIIVLDEPDSGLDHETATEVIRVLRSISLRGATVVAVTHHRHVLDLFDRVITMQPTNNGGRVVGESDLLPAEKHTVVGMPLNVMHQSKLLLLREYRKFTSPSILRFPVGKFSMSVPAYLLTLVIVPLFFAALISISVPTDPARNMADGIYGEAKWINRVGFLSIVSVVWMAASQSHLTFARQRELYDHEQSLGVSWACLLTAKGGSNTIVAIIQASVFLAFLFWIRSSMLDRSYFVTTTWSSVFEIWLCLGSVATAATALGLVISVAANRNPLIAAAWLPVVMMVQILFSVDLAVSDLHTEKAMDGYAQMSWNIDNSASEDVPIEKQPLRLTSRISYFTLSRYGDQWLRTFTGSVNSEEQRARWVGGAISGLSLSTIAYYLAALAFLYAKSIWQDFRRCVPPIGALYQAAGKGMAAIIGGLLLPTIAVAQNAVESPPSTLWKEISIPLVDERYDSNALRRQLGAHAPSTEQWRRLDAKDVLALTALQLAGRATIDVNDDKLQLRFAPVEYSAVVSRLAPCRLDIPGNLDGSTRTILFIHGLEGGASTFSQAREQCKLHGIIALNFDYPNDGPPKFAAAALLKELQVLSDRQPKLRLTIVAHSLGGLIAAWAVSEIGFPEILVTDVFTLGTPYDGSALAEFQAELELIDLVWRLAENDLESVGNLFHDGNGEAALDIMPGSEFLKQLHDRHLPETIRFHVGAGSRSFLTDKQRLVLSKSLPDELARMKVSSEYANKLLRLFQATEIQDGFGDGAVTVASATSLHSRHCTRTFQKTHLSLVSTDPGQDDDAVFSWIMNEMSWQIPSKK